MRACMHIYVPMKFVNLPTLPTHQLYPHACRLASAFSQGSVLSSGPNPEPKVESPKCPSPVFHALVEAPPVAQLGPEAAQQEPFGTLRRDDSSCIFVGTSPSPLFATRHMWDRHHVGITYNGWVVQNINECPNYGSGGAHTCLHS